VVGADPAHLQSWRSPLGEVWHVALLRNGAAYQTRFTSTADQAVKLAERLVNG
jgi:hypothetical protein